MGLRSTPNRHRSATSRLIAARSCGPRSLADAAAAADERVLVGVRQKSARRHQKGRAAHGRVEHLEGQDLVRRQVAHERRQRPAHEIVRDRLRGIERSGLFPDARSCDETDGGGWGSGPGSGTEAGDCGRGTGRSGLGCRLGQLRLVVEQRFVDGAELFDAQLAVGNSLAGVTTGRRTGRQREHHPQRGFVVQVAPLHERGAASVEQPSVERR